MQEGQIIKPESMGWLPEKVARLLLGEHVIKLLHVTGWPLMPNIERSHVLIRKERDGSLIFLRELSDAEKDSELKRLKK